MWNVVPWEITSAMEKAVTDGKVSFSRSGATNKNVNWLSLIIPNDANIVKNYLQEFKETNYIPQPLKESNQNLEYYQKRYDSSIKWIETHNHAVISNGPFYLESYSPESRIIKLNAFDDNSYPFKKGEWAKFENAEFPSIKKIDMKQIIQQGKELVITIETEHVDSILYFLTNSQGDKMTSNTVELKEKNIKINITSNNTKNLEIGTHDIKIFAVSNSVLKPDFIKSSFIVTDNKVELPISTFENVQFSKNESEYGIWIIPIIIITGIVIYLKKKN